jgi:hypothetical protein
MFLLARPELIFTLYLTRAAAKGGVEEDFFFYTFAFATRKLGEERMFFE